MFPGGWAASGTPGPAYFPEIMHIFPEIMHIFPEIMHIFPEIMHIRNTKKTYQKIKKCKKSQKFPKSFKTP